MLFVALAATASAAACGTVEDGSPTGPSFSTSVNYQSSEAALRAVAAQIDIEVGRPLEGFTVIADSRNVNVSGDTYSATYRAEVRQELDLGQLRDRILAQASGWRSGDVVLDDDSLDITFEKKYPAATVRGVQRIPDASVTISATVYPGRQLTAINYDVDITLR